VSRGSVHGSVPSFQSRMSEPASTAMLGDASPWWAVGTLVLAASSIPSPELLSVHHHGTRSPQRPGQRLEVSRRVLRTEEAAAVGPLVTRADEPNGQHRSLGGPLCPGSRAFAPVRRLHVVAKDGPWRCRPCRRDQERGQVSQVPVSPHTSPEPNETNGRTA